MRLNVDITWWSIVPFNNGRSYSREYTYTGHFIVAVIVGEKAKVHRIKLTTAEGADRFAVNKAKQFKSDLLVVACSFIIYNFKGFYFLCSPQI